MREYKKKTKPDSAPAKTRTALTPEARENQLIALAVDVAEEQLRNRTASSQVITHYLKMGSAKERLEKEIALEQIKLLRAKTEALQSNKHLEELYSGAIIAMQRYNGKEPDDNGDEE